MGKQGYGNPAGNPKAGFFFRIRKDLLHQGDILVDVVNKAGKPANVESWREVGEVAATLRLMERIRQEQLMRFSWGDEEEDEAIRLSQYPYLLLALMRCDNLVAEGYRILVPITNYTKFRNRLKALGYLL